MLLSGIWGQPLRDETKVVSGSIEIKHLARAAKIPYRDPYRKTGYQRKPQETRVNRFAHDIRKKNADVPTSILVNVRNGWSIEENYENNFVEIKIDDDQNIYIVDGQHRFLAFCKLYNENPELWGNRKLQFVMMLGASEEEEMEQFYVVNTTAKSVRTDLALDLLKQRAENDPDVLLSLTEKGQDWKIKAQAVVEQLNSKSHIWESRIRMANQEKGDTIIPAASFVSSLKSIFTSSPLMKKLDAVQSAGLIDTYWRGIRQALRDPFDGDSNHYALQKGVGVTAMHEILPLVIEAVRSSSGSVYEPDDYETIMRPVLMELSGDNVDGEVVSGSDFWLTAPRGGAAGSFSSSAGKRVLLAKLINLLPEPELE